MRGTGSLVALLTVVAIGLLAWVAMPCLGTRAGCPPPGSRRHISGRRLEQRAGLFRQTRQARYALSIPDRRVYVQSQVNQDTKQVTNTLVKRGKELHGPDIMVPR